MYIPSAGKIITKELPGIRLHAKMNGFAVSAINLELNVTNVQFEERLSRFAKNVIVLQGGMGIKQRLDIMKKLSEIPDDEERIILTTGRYLGEGFDDARLDTLFLTMPISWRGTLAQYAGRLHREYDHKTEVVIYDYVDTEVPILLKMWKRRIKGYQAIGYRIEN